MNAQLLQLAAENQELKRRVLALESELEGRKASEGRPKRKWERAPILITAIVNDAGIQHLRPIYHINQLYGRTFNLAIWLTPPPNWEWRDVVSSRMKVYPDSRVLYMRS